MVPALEALSQWSVLFRVVCVESLVPVRLAVPSHEPLVPRALFAPLLFYDPFLGPHVTIPRMRDPVVVEAIVPRYALL